MNSRLAHLLTIPLTADLPKRSTAAGTDAERYRVHGLNAKRRGVPFLLTFEEWIGWWQATGRYHDYGRFRGQYVMARKGDKGAYELGNIECKLSIENVAEAHLGKRRSEEVKRRMSEAQRKPRAPRS